MALQLTDVAESLIAANKLIRLEILPNIIKIKIRSEPSDRTFLSMPYVFHYGEDKYQYKDNDTIYITTTNPEDNACYMTKEFVYVRI